MMVTLENGVFAPIGPSTVTWPVESMLSASASAAEASIEPVTRMEGVPPTPMLLRASVGVPTRSDAASVAITLPSISIVPAWPVRVAPEHVEAMERIDCRVLKE